MFYWITIDTIDPKILVIYLLLEALEEYSFDLPQSLCDCLVRMEILYGK